MSSERPWAAYALEVLIGKISEDSYCAGWHDGIEFEVWRATKGDPRGAIPMDEIQVEALRELSALAGGWLLWADGSDGPQLVPLRDWEARCAESAPGRAEKP